VSVLHDAEHPARQARVGLVLVPALQRFQAGGLHQIVGHVAVVREPAGEAAQAGQQADDLGTGIGVGHGGLG